ncbi:MAG: DUF2993 domain-containing protein [Halothece sp.]
MFSDILPDVGLMSEQALNKVAELALSTQLNEADSLTVEVNTNPSKLTQGELESLLIDGKGLVMRKDFRMEVLQIQMSRISVDPMKAITGTIELTQPTQGSAHVVLTDADINRAFNSDIFNDQTKNIKIDLEGKQVTVDGEEIQSHFLGNGKVKNYSTIRIRETGEKRKIAFTTIPRIEEGGRGFFLDDVQYVEGNELSPKLTDAILKSTQDILSLKNYEIDGIALQVQQLDVQEGKLILKAIANVTKLPSTD